MGAHWTSIIIIALIVLILFGGAKKIPEIARGLKDGINEFKKPQDSKKKDESESSEKKS